MSRGALSTLIIPFVYAWEHRRSSVTCREYLVSLRLSFSRLYRRIEGAPAVAIFDLPYRMTSGSLIRTTKLHLSEREVRQITSVQAQVKSPAEGRGTNEPPVSLDWRNESPGFSVVSTASVGKVAYNTGRPVETVNERRTRGGRCNT